jgi:hypothetical protein
MKYSIKLDQSLLEDARSILQDQNSSYDWWDDLSEEDKNWLKESDAQFERGEYITFEELIQKLN